MRRKKMPLCGGAVLAVWLGLISPACGSTPDVADAQPSNERDPSDSSSAHDDNVGEDVREKRSHRVSSSDGVVAKGAETLKRRRPAEEKFADTSRNKPSLAAHAGERLAAKGVDSPSSREVINREVIKILAPLPGCPLSLPEFVALCVKIFDPSIARDRRLSFASSLRPILVFGSRAERASDTVRTGPENSPSTVVDLAINGQFFKRFLANSNAATFVPLAEGDEESCSRVRFSTTVAGPSLAVDVSLEVPHHVVESELGGNRNVSGLISTIDLIFSRADYSAAVEALASQAVGHISRMIDQLTGAGSIATSCDAGFTERFTEGITRLGQITAGETIFSALTHAVQGGQVDALRSLPTLEEFRSTSLRRLEELAMYDLLSARIQADIDGLIEYYEYYQVLLSLEQHCLSVSETLEGSNP